MSCVLLRLTVAQLPAVSMEIILILRGLICTGSGSTRVDFIGHGRRHIELSLVILGELLTVHVHDCCVSIGQLELGRCLEASRGHFLPELSLWEVSVSW